MYSSSLVDPYMDRSVVCRLSSSSSSSFSIMMWDESNNVAGHSFPFFSFSPTATQFVFLMVISFQQEETEGRCCCCCCCCRQLSSALSFFLIPFSVHLFFFQGPVFSFSPLSSCVRLYQQKPQSLNFNPHRLLGAEPSVCAFYFSDL